MVEAGSHDGVEEREVKLAVPADFAIPDLSHLAGVTTVDSGDETLHADYWDSEDLALARAGVGMRHRNGTWTYKGRSRREGDAVVREELEVAGDRASVPPPLVARITEWVDPDALRPIASLRTVRRRIDVTAAGESVELVHDRVTVLDGDRVAATFAEAEVEYPAGSERLAGRVVGTLTAAGALVDPTPKYVRALRALGRDPPEVC